MEKVLGAHALTLTEAEKKMSPKDEETDAGLIALSTSSESVFSGSLLPEAFFRDLLGAYNVVAAVDCTPGQGEFLKACMSARDSECPSLFMSDYEKATRSLAARSAASQNRRVRTHHWQRSRRRNMKRAMPRRRRRSRTLNLLRYRRPYCCQAVPSDWFECGF